MRSARGSPPRFTNRGADSGATRGGGESQVGGDLWLANSRSASAREHKGRALRVVTQGAQVLGGRAHPGWPVWTWANRNSAKTWSATSRRTRLRGRSPHVPVVEAPDPTMGVDGGGTCKAQLHGTSHRRVLLDPEMRPIIVVVSPRAGAEDARRRERSRGRAVRAVPSPRIARPLRSATGSGSLSAWARACG